MFNYTLLKGDAGTALAAPDAIAVSRRMAEAFFGSPEAAYGSTVRMNNEKDLRIMAVFENVPDNASQQFEFVGNYTNLLETVQWLEILDLSWTVHVHPITSGNRSFESGRRK
ncbi:MAG: ABC transporter permease [Bacteroidota bacterium]